MNELYYYWNYHDLVTRSLLSLLPDRLNYRNAFDGQTRKEDSSSRKFSGNGKPAILMYKTCVVNLGGYVCSS